MNKFSTILIFIIVFMNINCVFAANKLNAEKTIEHGTITENLLSSEVIDKYVDTSELSTVINNINSTSSVFKMDNGSTIEASDTVEIKGGNNITTEKTGTKEITIKTNDTINVPQRIILNHQERPANVVGIFDNFESYTDRVNAVSYSATNGLIYTWEHSTSYSPIIHTDYANSGVKSVRLYSGDLITKTNAWVTGKYDITFYMYFDSNQNSDINILTHPDLNTNPGSTSNYTQMQLYYNGSDWVCYGNGTDGSSYTNYITEDSFNKVQFIFDYDDTKIKMLINDNQIYSISMPQSTVEVIYLAKKSNGVYIDDIHIGTYSQHLEDSRNISYEYDFDVYQDSLLFNKDNVNVLTKLISDNSSLKNITFYDSDEVAMEISDEVTFKNKPVNSLEGYNIGDTVSVTSVNDEMILKDKNGSVPLSSLSGVDSSGSGSSATIKTDDGYTLEVSDTVEIIGGSNLSTSKTATKEITFNLNDNLNFNKHIYDGIYFDFNDGSTSDYISDIPFKTNEIELNQWRRGYTYTDNTYTMTNHSLNYVANGYSSSEGISIDSYYSAMITDTPVISDQYWELSFHYYNNYTDPSTVFFINGSSDYNGTSEIAYLQMSGVGHTEGGTFHISLYGSTAATKSFTSGGWFSIKILCDQNAKTVTYYVNGVNYGTVNYKDSPQDGKVRTLNIYNQSTFIVIDDITYGKPTEYPTQNISETYQYSYANDRKIVQQIRGTKEVYSEYTYNIPQISSEVSNIKHYTLLDTDETFLDVTSKEVTFKNKKPIFKEGLTTDKTSEIKDIKMIGYDGDIINDDFNNGTVGALVGIPWSASSGFDEWEYTSGSNIKYNNKSGNDNDIIFDNTYKKLVVDFSKAPVTKEITIEFDAKLLPDTDYNFYTSFSNNIDSNYNLFSYIKTGTTNELKIGTGTNSTTIATNINDGLYHHYKLQFTGDNTYHHIILTVDNSEVVTSNHVWKLSNISEIIFRSTSSGANYMDNVHIYINDPTLYSTKITTKVHENTDKAILTVPSKDVMTSDFKFKPYGLSLPEYSISPTNPITSEIYFNTIDKSLKIFDKDTSNWISFNGTGVSNALQLDDNNTVNIAGTINFVGHDIFKTSKIDDHTFDVKLNDGPYTFNNDTTVNGNLIVSGSSTSNSITTNDAHVNNLYINGIYFDPNKSTGSFLDVVSDESIDTGECVSIDSNGKLIKSIALASTPYESIGIATNSANTSEVISVQLNGAVNITGWALPGNPGDTLYLDDNTAGRLTTTAPSTSGTVIKMMAIKLSDDELVLQISNSFLN